MNARIPEGLDIQVDSFTAGSQVQNLYFGVYSHLGYLLIFIHLNVAANIFLVLQPCKSGYVEM